jgi:molybdate transport system permease protein
MSGWLSAPLLAFLALPLAALLLRSSPRELAAALAQPESLQAMGLSFATTLVSAGLTVAFGTPAAYWLGARSRRGRLGRAAARAVDTLIDLPTVLPPAVAGIALLLAFGRRGLIGQHLDGLGITLAFTSAAVVLAQTFVAAPFYIKAAAVAFGGIEPELKQAAALDGASAWQTFRAITVPLSRPALVSGAVMTWARALGEFGATILFAGNYPGLTQTMPLAIYVGFEVRLERAVALSVVLLACSCAALLLAKGLLGHDGSTPGSAPTGE